MIGVLYDNCFQYMEPLSNDNFLPSVIHCGGLIFHYGQPMVVKYLLCTTAWLMTIQENKKNTINVKCVNYFKCFVNQYMLFGLEIFLASL